jgi:hypothetical protein
MIHCLCGGASELALSVVEGTRPGRAKLDNFEFANSEANQ